MAKTFKDSRAAREQRQDRLQNSVKPRKHIKGRNLEQRLNHRMWNEELLA